MKNLTIQERIEKLYAVKKFMVYTEGENKGVIDEYQPIYHLVDQILDKLTLMNKEKSI